LSNVKSFWKDTTHTHTQKAILHHKHAEITVPSFYPPDAVQEYVRVTICAGPMGNLKKRQYTQTQGHRYTRTAEHRAETNTNVGRRWKRNPSAAPRNPN